MAAAVLAVVCFVFGWCSGTINAATPVETAYDQPWEDMAPSELSWVAEGTMERISELEDDLAYVQQLQRGEDGNEPIT